MQLILFTKFFARLSAAELGRAARELGFDGLDLAVRAGHPVNPDNAASALPEAMRLWRQEGVAVPLLSLETRWGDPDLPALRQVYETAGELEIPFIKIGYWGWQPGHPYWQQVDRHRRALEAFERLGERHGICSLVHTHSGMHYGCNVSAAMHLMRGFDPRHVAIYIDPAHLALVGEPLPMAIDIAGEYLRMVGVKNAAHERVSVDGKRTWKHVLPPLEEGLVDWPEAVRLLRQVGYDGPLAYHGEVTGYMPHRVGEIAGAEAALLRKWLAEA